MLYIVEFDKYNIGFSINKLWCTTGLPIGGQKWDFEIFDIFSFYVFSKLIHALHDGILQNK